MFPTRSSQKPLWPSALLVVEGSPFPEFTFGFQSIWSQLKQMSLFFSQQLFWGRHWDADCEASQAVSSSQLANIWHMEIRVPSPWVLAGASHLLTASQFSVFNYPRTFKRKTNLHKSSCMYTWLTNIYKVFRETHERHFFTSPKLLFYLQQQNVGLKKEWNAKLATWQNDETAVVF